jgi:predicted O-methyltransferase YrrM
MASISLIQKIIFVCNKKFKFLNFINLIFNIFSKNKYYSSNKIFNLINKNNKSKNLNYFIKELIENKYLQETWNEHKNTLGPSKYASWKSSIYKRIGNVLFFYALIRILRPKNVIETGTASGSMTSFILAALNKNKFGTLTSIDLPPKKNKLNMDFSLKKKQVGFWIPSKYKSRWNYLEGDSLFLLPKVLKKLKPDIFFHDSLHTASHMTFEYAIARLFVKNNGLVISDDTNWNNSFNCFLKSQDLIGYTPYENPTISLFVNSFSKEELQHSMREK